MQQVLLGLKKFTELLCSLAAQAHLMNSAADNLKLKKFDTKAK
jgi:hypothetical protein